MGPVISRRLVAGGHELINADQIGILHDLARQGEHQHHALLGGGDIRSTANRQYSRAGLVTGRLIDVARGNAIFLHESERLPRRGDLFEAHAQLLDDGDGRARKIRPKFALIVDQLNVGWIEILRFCADFVAPCTKVRRVVLAEMRKRVEAFFWRVWIEDNLDEPKKTIVFDDEFEAG
jgi:hypothetical protein